MEKTFSAVRVIFDEMHDCQLDVDGSFCAHESHIQI